MREISCECFDHREQQCVGMDSGGYTPSWKSPQKAHRFQPLDSAISNVDYVHGLRAKLGFAVAGSNAVGDQVELLPR